MRRNGNPAERCVAQILRDAGYLVASRRHEPGPGDHLALGHGLERALLVETKTGNGNLWENFRSDDRAAMISAGVRWRVTPLLAYVLSVKRREVIFLPVSDWPA